MVARLLVSVVLAVAMHAAPASAQEPSSTSTTLTEVPDQDIIPAPNTGEEPHESGERGGALQLAILALIVVAIVVAIALIVHQSRRAREGSS